MEIWKNAIMKLLEKHLAANLLNETVITGNNSDDNRMPWILISIKTYRS